MKKKNGIAYDFDKDLIGNLIAISPQRKLEEVAKECDIVFTKYRRQDVGLPQRINPDKSVLREALDWAMEHDQTCLVIEHLWFCVVLSRKTHPGGWLQSQSLWEATRTGDNNFEGV